jgi:hypothetical protein
LKQSTILVLISVIARLRAISCSSCDKDSPVLGLNGTESDWNIKVDIQELPRFLISLDIVECQDTLIKFEEVNSVR